MGVGDLSEVSFPASVSLPSLLPCALRAMEGKKAPCIKFSSSARSPHVGQGPLEHKDLVRFRLVA